ncbi:MULTISPECIES: DUF1189 domain-containing protein [unclassified Clostridium]|uniref:DUF1189 domain-containing protein n=1 Tax=unclassified Clostridium TaxID=2614128 RepID=UPI000297E487|nr:MULTISPECIES: DUF1189 domain-containing protein [unclassified Clostridium]EKQ54438.1 MAG: Protein of unknown function (DUF1189) [Clostridium sp. Maddingley MBC34-26]
MKTKMGFGQKFAYSFYDFAAYKEFVIQGLGKAIFYTFLVSLILSIITNIKTIDEFNSEISSVQATFIHSAPNFEFKDGILSVSSDEPIYYKHNDTMFIVDTSGKTTSSVLAPYSDGIYINSDTLTLRQNYNTVQTISLSEFNQFGDFVLTNKIVLDLFSVSKLIVPVLLLILNPIISFLVNLVSIFAILAPFSLSISSLMEVNLSYVKACTLSCYAITLPLLLEALLFVAGINIPEFYIIFYLIGVVYCGLAIKEIKKTDKSNLNYMN